MSKLFLLALLLGILACANFVQGQDDVDVDVDSIEEPEDDRLRRVLKKVKDEIQERLVPIIAVPEPKDVHIKPVSYEIVRKPNGLNFVVTLLVQKRRNFIAVIHIGGPLSVPELTAIYEKRQ